MDEITWIQLSIPFVGFVLSEVIEKVEECDFQFPLLGSEGREIIVRRKTAELSIPFVGFFKKRVLETFEDSFFFQFPLLGSPTIR